MRILPFSLLVGSALLASCATTHLSDADKLALYSSHASEPVPRIKYRDAIGWDTIGNRHLLLTVRPNEGWLLKLAPNCLDAAGIGAAVTVSHFAGVISAGSDKVTRISGPGASLSCRIEEIRVVDLGAVRDARNAMATNP